MPALRIRDHFTGREFAHLFADLLQRIVETAVSDQRIVQLADQFDEPRALARRIALGDKSLDRRRHARGDGGRGQTQIGKPHDLVLTHRNAAEDLREIFRGADAHDQVFDLAEQAFGLHPFRIRCELAQRFDIGCEPSQAVRGALFPVEKLRLRFAVDHHPVADAQGRVGEQPFRRAGHLKAARDQVAGGIVAQGGDWHEDPFISTAEDSARPA